MSVQKLALQSFRVIFLMRNKRGNWKVFQYCRRLSESGSGSRYSQVCTQVTKSAIYFILLLLAISLQQNEVKTEATAATKQNTIEIHIYIYIIYICVYIWRGSIYWYRKKCKKEMSISKTWGKQVKKWQHRPTTRSKVALKKW